MTAAESTAPAESPAAPSGPRRCLKPSGPFYHRIRPFAMFCKLMATFPLQNSRTRDGRKLRHKWFSGILFYDFAVFGFLGLFFIFNSINLIMEQSDKSDKYYLTIWLRFTIIAAGLRNLIQFFVCHIYAHKYPQLFAALEDFYQGIGEGTVEGRWRALYNQLIPIVRTLGFLLFLFASSYSFFCQFGPNSWLITLSYVSVNLWKELPMSMFLCICAHLGPRFNRVIKDLRNLRGAPSEDADVTARGLENARLRYAALTNILGLLQKCFGMQIAFNILFLVLDTILQLFIFAVFTGGQNLFLLTLSIYYFVGSCYVILIMDCFERITDSIIDELNGYELEGKSDSVKYQVQLFTSQVIARPVRISAAGFCIINNTLIAGIFGAIATYLIVMLNFSSYIVSWANETIPARHPIQHSVEYYLLS